MFWSTHEVSVKYNRIFILKCIQLYFGCIFVFTNTLYQFEVLNSKLNFGKSLALFYRNFLPFLSSWVNANEKQTQSTVRKYVKRLWRPTYRKVLNRVLDSIRYLKLDSVRIRTVFMFGIHLIETKTSK